MKKSELRLKKLNDLILMAASVICFFFIFLSILFFWPPSKGKYIESAWTADALKGSVWLRQYISEINNISNQPWTPYLHTRMPPYDGVHVKIAEDGSRNTWNQPKLQEGNLEQQIFMFGGSTLWGAGSRDEFTIPSFVAKKLASSGASFRVTNYGVNGDVSTQSMIRLIFELRRKNIPDIVVFYGGQMDAYAACNEQTYGAPLGNRYIARVLSGGDQAERIKLQFFDYLRLKIAGDVSPIHFDQSSCLRGGVQDVVEGATNIYLENLQFLNQLSKIYSFELFFYLEPLLSDKVHRTDYENKILEKTSSSASKTVYKLMRNKINIMKNGELKIYDLRSIFSKESRPIYIDSDHYSDSGNEIIAGKIANDIYLSYEKNFLTN